jgi:hypothetical protein
MKKLVSRIAAAEYRKKAADLRRLALKVEDDNSKASIERVAARWEARAEAAEAEEAI